MEEKENSRGGRKSEIRFDIKQHLGVLSASNRGWNKELNLVSWNGGMPNLIFVIGMKLMKKWVKA